MIDYFGNGSQTFISLAEEDLDVLYSWDQSDENLGFIPITNLVVQGNIEANNFNGNNANLTSNVTANNFIGNNVIIGNTTIIPVIQGYISGGISSNTAAQTNVSSGAIINAYSLNYSKLMCADQTTSYWIQVAATSKSVNGSFVSGSGANGLGTGLTLTGNTVYYPYAILFSNGATDIYFDTSNTAANIPSNAIAHRRIGSLYYFANSSLSTIWPTMQTGDNFDYTVIPPFVEPTTIAGTQSNFNLPFVPNTIPIIAKTCIEIIPSLGNSAYYLSPAFANGAFQFAAAAAAWASDNLAQGGFYQIPMVNGTYAVDSSLNLSYYLATMGWIDRREQDT
jgi:hypothetical protein